MPNCTSAVQPLDAGCIQSAKALFRKRHMSWILDELASTAPGEKPRVKCNIRQAIEWFMSALGMVSPSTIRNCWIKTQILTPTQAQDLATGERHNRRMAYNESASNPNACVPESVIEELADLLANLGKGLSVDPQVPVQMLEAVELLDLPMERVVTDPPETVFNQDSGATDGSQDDIEETEDPTLGSSYPGELIDMDDTDLNDLEPDTPHVTLQKAREAAETLYTFVSLNHDLIDKAAAARDFNSLLKADTMRYALQRMHTTVSTRQASLFEFFNA